MRPNPGSDVGVLRFGGVVMGRLTAAPLGPAMIGARLKLPPKMAERFYSSKEWRQLVARIKRQRGNWCQRCGSKHRVIGDHIIERRDGGADLDEHNVELLCQRCHQCKTADTQLKRARGQT